VSFRSVGGFLNALTLRRWRGVADGRTAESVDQQARTVTA
jgi:hypothetical protein